MSQAALCLTLVLALTPSTIEFAATEPLQAENPAPREILTYKDYAYTEDMMVSVYATISVQGSNSTIIGITQTGYDGWTDGVTDILVGSSKIWNNGAYATVTVTYKYNGKLYTSLAYFYPT